MSQFRTTFQPVRSARPISHEDAIVMLGSCFTDEVGALLARDGWDVTANPMGALYNPASIARVINRALSRVPYTVDDLTINDNTWHCLDFPSRYQDSDPDRLLLSINKDIASLASKLESADVWIITLGSAWVYERPDGIVAGNCHKLPSSMFNRRRLSVDEIVNYLEPLTDGRRVIFTVSPIRHLADGLHGNQLSKSTLLLALDAIKQAEYFPAYEILLDDLRDYRFYAADMKHPSAVAVDYIYEKLGETYFEPDTMSKAQSCRREYLRSAHRPIIQP